MTGKKPNKKKKLRRIYQYQNREYKRVFTIVRTCKVSIKARMSEIREIPGFYYDEERQRYFKITNGAIPQSSLSSLSKYHNNSIQAEQRTKQSKVQKISKPTKSSTNTIRNKKLDKFPKAIRSKYLTPSTGKFIKFTYTPIGLINFKSVTSTTQHDLLQSRLLSYPILKPKYIPMLTPRGYVLRQMKDYLIISRIQGITQRISSSRNEYYPTSLVLQRISDGKISKLKQDWYVVKSSNVESVDLKEYYETLGVDDFKTNIFHEVMESKEVVIISEYENFVQGERNSILRMNVLDLNKDEFVEHDYTLKLTKFLKDYINKEDKKTKDQLNRAFGIYSCFFSDNLYESSVDEINGLLRTPSKKSAAKVNNFLLLKDIAKMNDNIIYKSERYDNPKGIRILDCQFSKSNNHIHFLLSNSSLVSFKFQNGEFSDFHHRKIHDRILPFSQLCVYDEVKTIKTGNKFSVVDEKWNIKSHDIVCDYIRKIFMISSHEVVYLLKNSIIYWDITTNESSIILNYLNNNDINQQFEVYGNYLLYNIGNTLKFINIYTHESSSIDLEFQFKKCGYLKNFKLVKIVKLEEVNTRLHLGFTFLNSEEMTTIFETFLI